MTTKAVAAHAPATASRPPDPEKPIACPTAHATTPAVT